MRHGGVLQGGVECQGRGCRKGLSPALTPGRAGGVRQLQHPSADRFRFTWAGRYERRGDDGPDVGTAAIGAEFLQVRVRHLYAKLPAHHVLDLLVIGDRGDLDRCGFQLPVANLCRRGMQVCALGEALGRGIELAVAMQGDGRARPVGAASMANRVDAGSDVRRSERWRRDRQRRGAQCQPKPDHLQIVP